MLKKYMTAGLIGSAMLALAAFAQSPAVSTAAPAAAPVAASDSTYNGNWRASKVVGISVYNEANESLGSINDLLTDQAGNIRAAVIGVGGFLGVGERLIAVPFDKIKFVTEPVVSAAATGTATRPSPSTGVTTGAATATPAPVAKPNPWYPDHAVLGGANKDELKAMPEFKYSVN